MNLVSTHLGGPESDALLQGLAAGGITTVERVLTTNSENLASTCGLSITQVRGLKQGLAERCGVQPTPLSLLVNRSAGDTATKRSNVGFRGGAALSTGSRALDAVFGGDGLQRGTLTELVGQSSSGKTQVCLSVAARLLERDENAQVVFVDTSSSFRVERFIELFGASSLASLDAPNNDVAVAVVHSALSRLQCVRVFDARSAVSALERLLLECIEGRGSSVCCVILDSITPLVSPILGGARNTAGHQAIAEIGRLLLEVARTTNAAVLVTNATVRGELNGTVKPALGMTWSYVPHTQVLLQIGTGSVGTSGSHIPEISGSGDAGGNGSFGRDSVKVSVRTAIVRHSCVRRRGAQGVFEIGHLGVADVGSY